MRFLSARQHGCATRGCSPGKRRGHTQTGRQTCAETRQLGPYKCHTPCRHNFAGVHLNVSAVSPVQTKAATHTHTHTHTHARIRTHAHTRTHTHTRTRVPTQANAHNTRHRTSTKLVTSRTRSRYCRAISLSLSLMPSNTKSASVTPSSAPGSGATSPADTGVAGEETSSKQRREGMNIAVRRRHNTTHTRFHPRVDATM